MLETMTHHFSFDKQEILRESFEISQDYSCEFFQSHQIEVKNSVLVIGDKEEVQEFVEMLNQNSFEIQVFALEQIQSVSGKLGYFQVELENQSLEFAQIVLFYEDENLKRFKGCESVSEYAHPKELIEVLKSRVGEFKYHQIIHYDSKHCQYHHRRAKENGEEYCHLCTDVCPTWGVSKDSSLVELKFSSIDCISCGQCVMACPSGAIQRDAHNLESIAKIAKMYQGIVPVVMDQEVEGLDFKESLLFQIAQVHLLNEVYLLTLIQESASEVVIYDPSMDGNLSQSVELINQIFQAIFGKGALYLAANQQELQEYINLAKPCSEFFYTYSQDGKEPLRQIFAERLRYMVKNQNYGIIPNAHHIYGGVKVDSSKCTLCNSCVGACNVSSLNSANFRLSHNPSLCTACGYCLSSCPENAITLDFSGIRLEPQWFENGVVAEDRGFACVECGKVFANAKAIERVKNIMSPLFGGDQVKIRTLECCENCKAKLMLGLQ